jgi:hypothetical protein
MFVFAELPLQAILGDYIGSYGRFVHFVTARVLLYSFIASCTRRFPVLELASRPPKWL